MPIDYLTGTEEVRFKEIQKWSLTSEPKSDPRLLQYPLFTVPVGQTFAPSMIINTGSISMVTGTVEVQKNIHLFEDNEVAANKFINEVGTENLCAYIENFGIRPDLTSYKIIEAHLLNYPEIKVDFELLDIKSTKGFKIEVFASGSNGLTEVERRPVFDINGNLINDTFLKYFEIEVDI